MSWIIIVLSTLFVGSWASLNIPEYTNYSNNVLLSTLSDPIVNNFEEEYITFMKTGVESQNLKQLSKFLSSFTKGIFTSEIEQHSALTQVYQCTTCRAATRVLIRMVREGGELAGLGDSALKNTMIELCQRFEIETNETCEGIINIYYPTAKFLVQQSKIDSRSFCGVFLQAGICKVKDDNYDWKIFIDSKKLPAEGPKKEIPSKGNNDLNIVHVTDIHYDPLYQVGALAECDEALCCQLHKNVSENTEKAAGYWGDYRQCDIPWHAIADALKQIKKNHEKIDYVYTTGDVVDHASWLGSKNKNLESLKKVYQELKATFGDIPVYPTIGNHDSHPSHGFAPPNVTDDQVSTQWLYDLHADLWSSWLPASALETIKKGGYYTVSSRKGFRVVALNNNDCYTLNFWILYDGSYPSEQLQWLHDILLQAEKDGEHVHILAHIPSGVTSCWSVWSREFNRIVERFSNTISGIFNGHTHYDEFSVYYANKTTPVNVAWNGGSLTTYNSNKESKNPNYKIYQVEPTSFQVVDQETWFFNLTKANLKPEESPKWELEYKMSDEFNMTDLSPASVDGLLTKFAETPSLLRKYWCKFVVKSDPMIKAGCSSESLKSLICRLARSDNTQTERCEMLQSKLQENLDAEQNSGIDGSCVCVTADGGALAVALKITTLLFIYFGTKILF
ncbi:sphingomyelin phosphodiesterase-like [Episyrphus balteatus]|uniref:sphingomyelin phosphodiesterase-like n=1 Tax=Episyrphus balteatus TaxID=286459 RepID=UPI0024856C4A|nr:sphingomyelin phosphodiesterase-like [Episyrphus balteatus]